MSDYFIKTPKNSFFDDSRGNMKIIFNRISPTFKNFKINYCFTSFNKNANTFRGIHFQNSKFSQNKIIILNYGEIIDYVIDLRKKSKTFLKIFKFRISHEDKKYIFIPKGFGHAYFTIKPNTSMTYLTDNFYDRKFYKGINYKDPIFFKNFKKLNVRYISKKDMCLPKLNDIINELKFK